MVSKITTPPTNNEVINKINEVIDNLGGSTESFIPYGESDSVADATQKEVTISSITSLSEGQIIIVKPTITSTVADATLKLNNFTAYPILYGTAAITTSTDSITWAAGYPSWFRFDGSNWVFLGHGVDNNTTYSAMSVSEGTTGTATTARVMRADRLKSIILGTKLTGLSTSTSSAVAATDTVLVGMGKLQAEVNTKQATLVSGTNIKTVGGTSLLGSGNIALPTVNNATLTIQKNGTNVATFTANASSNVTANISVPNTVSSVSSSSTNADAVGAKLFYDTVGDIESALHAINSGGVQTATLTVRVLDHLRGFYSFTINGETYTDFSTSGDIGEYKTKDINIPINTDLPWTASAESSFKVTPASGTLNISSDYILELDIELDEPIIEPV